MGLRSVEDLAARSRAGGLPVTVHVEPRAAAARNWGELAASARQSGRMDDA